MKKLFLKPILFLAIGLGFVAQTQAMQPQQEPTTTTEHKRPNKNRDEVVEALAEGVNELTLHQQPALKKPKTYQHSKQSSHHRSHDQRPKPVDDGKFPDINAKNSGNSKDHKKPAPSKEELLYEACRTGDMREVSALLASRTPPKLRHGIIKRAMRISIRNENDKIYDVLFEYLVESLKQTDRLSALEEECRILKSDCSSLRTLYDGERRHRKLLQKQFDGLTDSLSKVDLEEITRKQEAIVNAKYGPKKKAEGKRGKNE